MKKKTGSFDDLITQNRSWAVSKRADTPTFFDDQARSQAPETLWIGCSDSRVSPENILNLEPGDIFVHRNIANVVTSNDDSCQAVLQFAVESLKVKHIIVCGHSSCGGVKAALINFREGQLGSWLEPIYSVIGNHREQLEELDLDARTQSVCKLNACAQARNVCASAVVQRAWTMGQDLTVHAWLYDLKTGHVEELMTFQAFDNNKNAIKANP